MTSKAPKEVPLPLTGKELEAVRQIAEREGVSVEEAASKLASDAMARRLRSKTGHAPGRVYSIKQRRG